jgi:O-antigen/teichoic acid export membrane protein
LRGAEESGWYRAPVLVLEGLTLVPRVLGFAFIPAMAAWHVSAPASVSALYRRGVKYLLLVGLPIAAFGALAHVPFVRLLFGPAYDPSAAAARILIPTCVLMFLSNLAETTLACIDRWRAIVISSTLALGLNVALNLAWIPRYGYVGAAWATLLTEGAYFATATWALQRAGHSVAWVSTAWRPMFAAIAFGGVLFTLLPGGLLAASAAASCAWIAATFALGVWDARERQALMHLLRRPARA